MIRLRWIADILLCIFLGFAVSFAVGFFGSGLFNTLATQVFHGDAMLSGVFIICLLVTSFLGFFVWRPKQDTY